MLDLFEHLVYSLLLALVLFLLFMSSDLLHCEGLQLFLGAENIDARFESRAFELEKVGVNVDSCLHLLYLGEYLCAVGNSTVTDFDTSEGKLGEL